MIEDGEPGEDETESGARDWLPASDVASYLFDITQEMASLARGAGLIKLALSLEQARAFAAESLIDRRRAGQPAENAESGDAA